MITEAHRALVRERCPQAAPFSNSSQVLRFSEAGHLLCVLYSLYDPGFRKCYRTVSWADTTGIWIKIIDQGPPNDPTPDEFAHWWKRLAE